MGDRRDQGPSLRWSPEWDAGPVWCEPCAPRRYWCQRITKAGHEARPWVVRWSWGYLAFVPNIAVTVANGPVMVIWYVADESASDFVARL